jgi:tetratricopeptide (TPR) repeat protein
MLNTESMEDKDSIPASLTLSGLPDDIMTILNRAERLVRPDSRRPAFFRILSKAPQDLDALAELGSFFKLQFFDSADKADAKDAETVFRYLLQLDPENVPALHGLHVLYKTMDDPSSQAESTRLLMHANRLNPNYSTWHAADDAAAIQTLAKKIVA